MGGGGVDLRTPPSLKKSNIKNPFFSVIINIHFAIQMQRQKTALKETEREKETERIEGQIYEVIERQRDTDTD